jgi:hypothetical protein
MAFSDLDYVNGCKHGRLTLANCTQLLISSRIDMWCAEYFEPQMVTKWL